MGRQRTKPTAGTMGVMHWNFEDSRKGRLRLGVAFDVLLFFVAVVLVIAVAVLPTSHFTSGAVPGQNTFWGSLILTGPIAFLAIIVYARWRTRLVQKDYLAPPPEELTVTYRLVNGLVVLMIGGWAAFGALNAWLDRGVGDVYYTHVLDKRVEDDGRFENYLLTLENWQGRGRPLVMTVDSEFYDGVTVTDSCLRLVIKPGAFGHEWISDRQYFQRHSADLLAVSNWRSRCRAEWQARSAELGTKPQGYSHR